VKNFKVVELPLATIAAILQHAQIPAKATEDSPVSRPRLPPQAIAALLHAQSSPDLVGFAVRAEDATALVVWLRSVADELGAIKGAQFRNAAERIERTETAA